MAERALPNPYADYNRSLAEGYCDAAGALTAEFSQRLNNEIRELLQRMERGLKSADPRDGTAYTGWTGRRCSWGAGMRTVEGSHSSSFPELESARLPVAAPE
nr:PREDICTED: lanC-like protein 1 [Equus przewalskii]